MGVSGLKQRRALKPADIVCEGWGWDGEDVRDSVPKFGFQGTATL